MSKEYLNDLQWTYKFTREIKQILGLHFFRLAPRIEDQEHNTDFIVFELKNCQRIACRIRRPDWFPRYRDEFTLRSSRPNGWDTELQKLLHGWGDYLFYGFAAFKPEDRLIEWRLCNLTVFCKVYKETMGKEKKNRDGSSSFRVFKWSEFPPEFVVAKGEGLVDIIEPSKTETPRIQRIRGIQQTLTGLGPSTPAR